MVSINVSSCLVSNSLIIHDYQVPSNESSSFGDDQASQEGSQQEQYMTDDEYQQNGTDDEQRLDGAVDGQHFTHQI